MSDAHPAPQPAPAPTPPPPAPPPAPSPVEAETFSKDYVRELRAENKGWRLKAQEQEASAASAKLAAEQAKAEAEARVVETKKESDVRIIRAELKAHAIRAGIADMDYLKLIDTSEIKLDEKGEVIIPDDFFAKIKAAKPHFFGAPPSTTSNPTPAPSPAPPANKSARDMTPAELRQLERSLNIRT